MTNAEQTQLREVLTKYYNKSELHTMCFDLGIEYEDLAGSTKSAKARDLVTYVEKMNLSSQLIAYIQKTRPHVTFTNSGTSHTTTVRPQPPIVQEVHNYYGNVNQQGDVTTTTTQGDTFNMSGDFRGANLNVKSTLTNVNQTIGALSQADEAAKAELQQLIAQLNEALQQAPADKAEEADAVVQMTEALVETAASDKPNKMMIQITGDGLKKAAENLAGIVPNVVKIAGAIVTGILALA